MDVIIRTDASVAIGSGHVMRCLTIAKKLQQAGCSVRFWMETLEGNLIDYVEAQGFSNIEGPEQANLYIVDHYGLGVEWEQSIRSFTKKLAVIDDLAREHDCDLLLDQNFLPQFETRYDDKLPLSCKVLLGPKFLIMRDEFVEARKKITKRNLEINRILLFMGGTDPTQETMKVLEALEHKSFNHIDVVVGNGNQNKVEIETICKQRGYFFHCQIDYMAELMLLADYSIGAGGSTVWERCYLGLPSSSTIVADNQRIGTTYADEIGFTKCLGWHEQVTIDDYLKLLSNIEVGNMSRLGLELTQNEKPNPWLDELMELIKC